MAETKVKLSLNDREYFFPIKQAQKILNSKNNKLIKGQSFVLTDDKFELDNANNIIRRKKDKGNSGKSTSQSGDKQS
jgi:hypothetical protein